MKLLHKHNRLTITATIITFVIGSCAFYFVLHYILIRQIDETLVNEQQEIVTYTNAHNALPEIIRTEDQYTSYTAATSVAPVSFENVQGIEHKEAMREVTFGVQAGTAFYLVTVARPLEETEDLLQLIIGVTVGMIALILLVGYFINRVVIQKLWRPFYKTIAEVEHYQLTDETLQLEQGDIDEFSLLNKSINALTERVQRDYTSLKDLTGQAAHELQTPLAIIRTKLDLLMQNEDILAKHAQHIADIEQAVQRSARLQQSLLLLTKVENRQFALNEPVVMDTVISRKIAELAEAMEAKGLTITVELEPTVIKFHQHLAEIIISNLLSNAVRYNSSGGSIAITLQDKRLTVRNSSPYPQLDGERLFKRFYRGGQGEDGNGLGLSIVKQVCDVAGYSISYNYASGQHCFIIKF